MDKEEFINFINSIDFKVIKNFTLTYVKEEQHSPIFNENAQPKTITFGKDYEILINEKYCWMDRKIDDLHKELDKVIKGVE